MTSLSLVKSTEITSHNIKIQNIHRNTYYYCNGLFSIFFFFFFLHCFPSLFPCSFRDQETVGPYSWSKWFFDYCNVLKAKEVLLYMFEAGQNGVHFLFSFYPLNIHYIFSSYIQTDIQLSFRCCSFSNDVSQLFFIIWRVIVSHVLAVVAINIVAIY